MANVLNHGEIVRDKQIRQVELLLEIHQQVDDLGLHRHVERRHGLVADDEPGLHRQGARDPQALALAAREFERILDHLVGAQPDALEQTCHALACLRGTHGFVVAQRLGDDFGGTDARVQRRVGILEDGLQLAANRPQFGLRQVVNWPAVPEDFAGGRILQAQDQLAGGRFAAARFADQPERFALGNREAHAIDGTHQLATAQPAMLGWEMLAQAPDLEQCGGNVRRCRHARLPSSTVAIGWLIGCQHAAK